MPRKSMRETVWVILILGLFVGWGFDHWISYGRFRRLRDHSPMTYEAIMGELIDTNSPLIKENSLLREKIRVLEEELAKVRKVIEQGSE